MDGVLARLSVTKANIDSLKGAIDAFCQKNQYTIAIEENRKEGGSDFVVRGAKPFPQEIAVSVGMAAHNMRATLDGLAYQLTILAADGHPREEDLLAVQFPIRLHGPRSKVRENRRRKEPKFSWRSGSFTPVGQAYLARLEGLQPYKRGRGHRRNPLWLLDRLNNADKHRLVVVLAVVSTATTATLGITRGRVLLPGGRPYFRSTTGGLRINAGVPLVDGAKVAHAKAKPPEVNVKIKVATSVRFGDACAAVKGRNVVETLAAIRNEVASIVESFRPDFT